MRTEVIFDPKSQDVTSRPFYLLPRTTAIVRGYNFPEGQVTDDPNSPSYTPAACLYMLKLEPYERPSGLEKDEYGWWPLPTSTRVLVETSVVVDDCAWQIHACHNQQVLDIPGYYRFVLNSGSLVGLVHLYADIWPAMEFKGSGAVSTFFGGVA